jgi:bifunctional UDP-N-acetylglucosamine pyrophosphorylase/glucosamine-1-phosphate N-acetyltransferase
MTSWCFMAMHRWSIPTACSKRFQSAKRGADVVVLGFRAADPTGYGRLIEHDGELIAIREHKDASAMNLPIDFCNGGIITFSARKA